MNLSKRLTALFLAALLGVLLAIGLALSALGWVAVVVYAVVVVAGLGLLASKAPRPARPAGGQTCTCCTSTVHDPVKVI